MECCALSIFGAVSLFYIGFNLLSSAYNFIRVYLTTSHTDFSNFGKWAIVTGGSEGIGREIAEQIAATGCSIVILSLGDVEKVASEIKEKYGVDTKYLLVDFSVEGQIREDMISDIQAFIGDLDVGVLVNNVGIGPMGTYLDTPQLSSAIQNILNINARTVCEMTSTVLPGMVQRRRGMIINISSLSAARPIYGASLYGATKAFVAYFSETIRLEYQCYGIHVKTVLPGFISTSLTKDMSWVSLQPHQYVTSLLSAISKTSFTYGYWKHALLAMIAPLFPEKVWIQNWRKRLQQIALQRKQKQ